MIDTGEYRMPLMIDDRDTRTAKSKETREG